MIPAPAICPNSPDVSIDDFIHVPFLHFVHEVLDVGYHFY
jgi:hypothetical protein